MSPFRGKPVEIEAVLWDGSKEAMDEIHALGGWKHVAPNPPADDLIIDTLEGEMRAQIGDWVIRGVHGEFYSCKPDIFEATYEAVAKRGDDVSSIKDDYVRWLLDRDTEFAAKLIGWKKPKKKADGGGA